MAPDDAAAREDDEDPRGTWFSAPCISPPEGLSCSYQSADPMDVRLHHHGVGFGTKTIGLLGSCVLNFNNITGPAMVVLPLLYQEAGWFLPTLGLLAMYIISSFSATMICESMQLIPGNKSFGQRYEYCSVVRHYFGKHWYLAAQVGFNAGLLASNIAAMIVTSQVLDATIHRMFGKTYGLDYYTWPPKYTASMFETSGCQWGLDSSGSCKTSVISLGFLACMVICVPFGTLNLDDNMSFQWLSMVAQLVFSLEFIGQFITNLWPGFQSYCPDNGPQRTPFWGLDISQACCSCLLFSSLGVLELENCRRTQILVMVSQQELVIGVCVFSYSYVSTIPSWANEKRPGVNVNTAVWAPATAGVTLNVLLGILPVRLLGAWAYNLLDKEGHPISGTENILNVLTKRVGPGTTCTTAKIPRLTEASVYMWGIFGYVPGIPVLSIMVRYNLHNGGLLGHKGAFLAAVVAPWVITAFCYQAQILVQFCNWVAILFQGTINLIVPALLYRAALLRYSTVQACSQSCPNSVHREGASLNHVMAQPLLREGPAEALQARRATVVEVEALRECSSEADDTDDCSRRNGGPCMHHNGGIGHGSSGAPSVVMQHTSVEKPVTALPAWLGIDPLSFAHAMAIMCGIIVISSIFTSLYFSL
eukprot:SM000039S14445  [mRNA]  locus=s39:101468:105072:- [translate_table: standard]